MYMFIFFMEFLSWFICAARTECPMYQIMYHEQQFLTVQKIVSPKITALTQGKNLCCCTTGITHKQDKARVKGRVKQKPNLFLFKK